MELFYPFFITFSLVFFSELGDKTQLFVISFSTKNKAKHILLGVALGTFFSHGLGVLFGSKLACFSNESFQFYLKFLTYISFLFFGIIGFLPKKTDSTSSKSSFLERFSSLNLNCIIIIAICIFVGELGDKTFLASLSLGFEYPNFKIPLLLGSVCGMVASNFIAIFCGKLIGNHLKTEWIEILSNITFLILGFFGLIQTIF